MDIEQWLSEIAGDDPCGSDLEYDNEFLAFEQLSRGKPEQQYGDTVIPAEDPDWRALDRAAEALFKRSKDLRVAATLARAWTRLRGMQGFADALELTHALLERHWDGVHPRLEIDGEYDPVPRANAIGTLADPEGLMRDLRAATLLPIPGSPILVRDAEAALLPGAVQGEGATLSRGQLTGMLNTARADGSPELAELMRARDTLDGIRILCLDKLGPESSPDFNALTSLLALLTSPMQDAQGGAEGATDSATGGYQETPGDMPVRAPGAALSGDIRSREDASRALSMVCDYLERHEPTNPAPLLIRRAQRMMTMDFMAIISELAPDSVNQVEMVTGTHREYSE
jgi:type VI secretion system protein ImpA